MDPNLQSLLTSDPEFFEGLAPELIDAIDNSNRQSLLGYDAVHWILFHLNVLPILEGDPPRHQQGLFLLDRDLEGFSDGMFWTDVSSGVLVDPGDFPVLPPFRYKRKMLMSGPMVFFGTMFKCPQLYGDNIALLHYYQEALPEDSDEGGDTDDDEGGN